MPSRMQITLSSETQLRAKRRAAELGISFAEYVRQVIERDLGEPAPARDISAIVGMFSGDASDVARNKHRYIGEAVYEEYLRDVGELRDRE